MRAQLVLVSVPRLPLKGVRSMSPRPDFRGVDRERCVSYFTLLWWSKNTLSAVTNDLCVVVGSSGGPLLPSPPAEKATGRQSGKAGAGIGDRRYGEELGPANMFNRQFGG